LIIDIGGDGHIASDREDCYLISLSRLIARAIAVTLFPAVFKPRLGKLKLIELRRNRDFWHRNREFHLRGKQGLSGAPTASARDVAQRIAKPAAATVDKAANLTMNLAPQNDQLMN
jgi:hypothetical protein